MASLAEQLKADTVGWTKPQRVALVIQYIGTRFHGWQRQPQQRTVQGEIEAVIEMVLGYFVTLHGAGRTDAGVHAAAQVAHFDAPTTIPAHRWASILNHRLSADIVIRASAQVSNTWHAQFSAQWRRYRYSLYTDPCPNLFVQPYTWHYYYEPLDVERLQAALAPLVGHHDLTAFHRAGSGRGHSRVEVQAADCYRQESFIHVELQASGFLYGMVRLIMGLLVDVGCGSLTVDAFTQIWQRQQRERVKYSAPAHGLCLLRVGYPEFPFASHLWFDTQPRFCFAATTDLVAV
ncbi:tRNA pseudouridine synthase A [Halomicronema hongdechloris C2206]|uniref:tRNA pseudouridine synthase A n=1 Tax=Halomicronema hongdechloris C2206 TaxID=1641165 RepID=A0A1Z3HVM4_9CYAN|nr:tRNA pseudouridine(38-40) synthase TruA [Halomicronema hongdechloris]ASC74326.1 tRNA pseudouridine synthase A [Halomicronema hongdechloris C2206]